MMRKETAFIIGFLVLTISTSVVIWTFALPNFKPVSFPPIASGVIDVGPMHHQRPLEADEVVDVNKWLSSHKSGWGPLSRTPPSSGDSHLLLKDAQGKDVLTLTLWTGISAADWNATVFVESPDGSWVRSETFPNKEFAPLRMMVDRYPFKHSSFP